jgi:hypothetical protein
MRKGLEVIAIQVAVLRPVEQPADVSKQPIEPLLLLPGGEPDEHGVVGVGVERLVGVLQLDLLAVEAQVVVGLERFAQLPQQVAIDFGQGTVTAQQLDQLGRLQRDEVRGVL